MLGAVGASIAQNLRPSGHARDEFLSKVRDSGVIHTERAQPVGRERHVDRAGEHLAAGMGVEPHPGAGDLVDKLC